MKKILLLSYGLFASIGASAQSDSIEVLVKVMDAFTGEIIEDGEVEALTPDSSFVSKGEWAYNTDNGVRTVSWGRAKVPKNGKYLFRFKHKNYFTTYFPFEVKLSKRAEGFVILKENVKMRKRLKEKVLGEAVVKATKIKMVMKNDTIVYNADAFQLSQGSMLDALIEQLPGAELKENGVITVQGRTISSLLVNGKDFFRGDPRIALENLPAYMVDKVKVYEEQTDFEKMTGKKEIERPLVMDVNLKKQYSIGWIANAEAAYGTEEKYIGRLFAMRFTDCSRLAFFGNFNNTNDTRRPGSRGDWTPSYLPDGLQTSKSGGGEYYYENRHKTFEWVSNVNAAHTNNHTIWNTSSESFLPADRAFSQNQRNERSRTTSFNTSHRFKVKKKAQHTGNIYFGYDKNRYSSLNRAGEFDCDPYSVVTSGVLDSLFLTGTTTLQRMARYRRRQEARNRGENWTISGTPYHLWWLPFKERGLSDMITFDLAGSYDKHTSRAFDKYDLEYLNSENVSDDNRNRYQNKPSRHYNYSSELRYAMFFGSIWPSITYGYSQDYRSGRSDLFRLDRLEGWGADTDQPLGTLPSAASDMQQALDIQNSEHSELWKRKHNVSLRLEYRSKKDNQTFVVAELPVRFELDHLLYDRSGHHYDLHRTKALFTPSGYIQQVIAKGDARTSFKLNYSLSNWMPDLVNTIELVNDANPLYIQMGNASLRRSTTHSLSFNLYRMRKWRRLCDLNLSYQRTRNALANERTYNPATGGYTVRPVNVDGNWRTDGNLSIDRQFGKQKQFSWANNTSYSFDHNVDMANVEGSTVNSLSTIKSLYLREQFTFSYSQNGWNIGAKLRGSYNRLTGDRSDFSNISAWDYNYGLTARIPLPWGIGLTTDFTVFSRRGYNDPSLNTDNFVWNARVERSILNGNLTFMLDGFDLLHDLSKVTRTVNAQGRTESYANVIPSYFMAHVIYKLNRQPKKKTR